MVQFAPPNPARAKRPKPVVLPHGTAHKTPASSQLIRLGIGAVRSVLGGRKKKMSSRVRSSTRRSRSVSRSSRRSNTRTNRSRRNTRSSRPSRLVKGSAAAKRYMAKIRKLKK